MVAPPLVVRAEPLKLSPLPDDKSFIDHFKLVQYYLWVPEYSTGWLDDALITDAPNLDASWMWEGQLRLAVKDGSLCFVFENKGDAFNGHGFKMLAALTQHCCPDSASDAFTSLMMIINDVQGQDKPIL